MQVRFLSWYQSLKLININTIERILQKNTFDSLSNGIYNLAIAMKEDWNYNIQLYWDFTWDL